MLYSAGPGIMQRNLELQVAERYPNKRKKTISPDHSLRQSLEMCGQRLTKLPKKQKTSYFLYNLGIVTFSMSNLETITNKQQMSKRTQSALMFASIPNNRANARYIPK